jgi:glycosyltransferase involved in cell wall biosynthesis/SAM-dependent methyltransferase
MLTEAQIKECQSKFHLTYHVHYANLCEKLLGFENKDVLEIGGSLPADFVFNYFNPKSWSALETPDYEKSLREVGGLHHQGTIIKDINIKDYSQFKFNNQQQKKYNLYLENIEDLPENYYNQYDLIFSIATFEHIHKLPLALEKMFFALKPGGKLFSLFSPIWSAYNGHHLPNIIDEQGNLYNFANSPIPPWGHLLMGPSEMTKYLYQKIDKKTADLIVYYVYQSDHINRFFTEDYNNFLEQSFFTIKKFELSFTIKVEQRIQTSLELRYPGRKEFANNGILLVLEKEINKKKEVNVHMHNNTITTRLNQAENYFRNQKFVRAAQIYNELLQETPELAKQGLGIRLAHALILSLDWQQVSANIIKGTNYLDVSGWLNSLFQGKPINRENKPIPWYTYPAIEFIEDKIESNFKVFEFGSGNSTLWWAEKVNEVISIESDGSWFNLINQQMPSNVQLHLESDEQKYADFISQYPDRYFDLIVIDGANRNSCLNNSLNKLKDDGWLIFDNTDDHRYDRSLKILASNGYKRIDFWGLIPTYTYKNCTSIFFRSTQILETSSLPSEKKSSLGESCLQIINSIREDLAVVDPQEEWQLTTPVCFLIFNRPHHTAKVFEAIRQAKPPKLLVVADGPRGDRSGEAEKCAATRAIIDQVDWDCEVLTNYADVNLGCRKRVSSGLDWLFEQVEEAIILEDDCLPDPSFFPYCEELLEKYRGWYYTPHEGQHISIYTKKSLAIIAEKYHLKLYTNGNSLHLLTSKDNLSDNLWEELQTGKLPSPQKESLLSHDFNQTVNHLFFPTAPENITDTIKTPELQKPIILIDGVFFQLYKTGIARVWRSLLQQWANTEFASHILVLDRANTAPQIPGIRYRTIAPYDYNNTKGDRQLLEKICDEEKADLFISTYYTTPLTTPSVFMAYDFAGEVLRGPSNDPVSLNKADAIKYSSHYISISDNTARDLNKFFPDIPLESINVAHCGVDRQVFKPATSAEINAFKYKYGINKPYFMLVNFGGHKNGILFFQAFSQLPQKQAFDIFSTDANLALPPEYRQYTQGCTYHNIQLSDAELRLAYAGAIAFVYPSKYEGFGLPVAEAMACGCPVITTANASLPEVGGEAVIYVKDNDVDGLADALCEVQKPKFRKHLIEAGLKQAQKFSWAKMAAIVKQALLDAILPPLNLGKTNYLIFPDWQTDEETLALELMGVIEQLATVEDNPSTTLLIDTAGINQEDANLLLSGITMNLILEKEIDVSETLQISLVGDLTENQWQRLLPQITARIKLEKENSAQIAKCQGDRLVSLNLKGNNYIIFPDWQTDEETLALELMGVIQQLATVEDNQSATLLIDTTNINPEQANLLLSTVTMNLMLEEDMDISKTLEISLLSELNENQWPSIILKNIDKITLENENQEAMDKFQKLQEA